MITRHKTIFYNVDTINDTQILYLVTKIYNCKVRLISMKFQRMVTKVKKQMYRMYIFLTKTQLLYKKNWRFKSESVINKAFYKINSFFYIIL